LIFEKLDTQFDCQRLWDHIQAHAFPLPIIQQAPSFGGWSVLSSNGSYSDGFQMGHVAVTPKASSSAAAMTTSSSVPSETEILAHLDKIGFKAVTEYCVPTELCHGYMKEVVDRLTAMKLAPCRVRIIRLTRGMSSVWHQDGPENGYFVRIHIPIITNPACFFEISGDKSHMAADGSSYFVHVNRMHRVTNGGDQDRYHIIADVTDTAGVSKFHRFTHSEEMILKNEID